MRKIILKYSSFFVMILALLPTGRSLHASEPSDRDGTLVVLVTWGDVDNTPANDVYIEAHGFVVKYHEEKSFVLKMSHAGRLRSSTAARSLRRFYAGVCQSAQVLPDTGL
jgi:hypothetical protein